MSTEFPDWTVSYDRRVLVEVDSTNAEAHRIAAGLSRPTWVLGLRQTAGRGRRGRPWADPQGNFSATLVLPDAGGAQLAAQRSFVAALALSEALVTLSGRPAGFSLKWPNDVLLNGAKLAGILLETSGGGTRPTPLCIGIGVNLLNAPAADGLEAGSLAPTSLLEETGVRVTPEELLGVLGPAYARWESELTVSGFSPIREGFLARAARLGEAITARTQRSETRGTFEGIDDTGALLLLTSQGRVAIPAADVYF